MAGGMNMSGRHLFGAPGMAGGAALMRGGGGGNPYTQAVSAVAAKQQPAHPAVALNKAMTANTSVNAAQQNLMEPMGVPTSGFAGAPNAQAAQSVNAMNPALKQAWLGAEELQGWDAKIASILGTVAKTAVPAPAAVAVPAPKMPKVPGAGGVTSSSTKTAERRLVKLAGVALDVDALLAATHELLDTYKQAQMMMAPSASAQAPMGVAPQGPPPGLQPSIADSVGAIPPTDPALPPGASAAPAAPAPSDPSMGGMPAGAPGAMPGGDPSAGAGGMPPMPPSPADAGSTDPNAVAMPLAPGEMPPSPNPAAAPDPAADPAQGQQLAELFAAKNQVDPGMEDVNDMKLVLGAFMAPSVNSTNKATVADAINADWAAFKSGSQDNSVTERRSATGESKGLAYKHKSDDYAKGPDAWDSVGQYLKKKPEHEPDPFAGKHASLKQADGPVGPPGALDYGPHEAAAVHMATTYGIPISLALALTGGLLGGVMAARNKKHRTPGRVVGGTLLGAYGANPLALGVGALTGGVHGAYHDRPLGESMSRGANRGTGIAGGTSLGLLGGGLLGGLGGAALGGLGGAGLGALTGGSSGALAGAGSGALLGGGAGALAGGVGGGIYGGVKGYQTMGDLMGPPAAKSEHGESDKEKQASIWTALGELLEKAAPAARLAGRTGRAGGSGLLKALPLAVGAGSAYGTYNTIVPDNPSAMQRIEGGLASGLVGAGAGGMANPRGWQNALRAGKLEAELQAAKGFKLDYPTNVLEAVRKGVVMPKAKYFATSLVPAAVMGSQRIIGNLGDTTSNLAKGTSALGGGTQYVDPTSGNVVGLTPGQEARWSHLHPALPEAPLSDDFLKRLQSQKTPGFGENLNQAAAGTATSAGNLGVSLSDIGSMAKSLKPVGQTAEATTKLLKALPWVAAGGLGAGGAYMLWKHYMKGKTPLSNVTAQGPRTSKVPGMAGAATFASAAPAKPRHKPPRVSLHRPGNYTINYADPADHPESSGEVALAKSAANLWGFGKSAAAPELLQREMARQAATPPGPPPELVPAYDNFYNMEDMTPHQGDSPALADMRHELIRGFVDNNPLQNNPARLREILSKIRTGTAVADPEQARFLGQKNWSASLAAQAAARTPLGPPKPSRADYEKQYNWFDNFQHGRFKRGPGGLSPDTSPLGPPASLASKPLLPPVHQAPSPPPPPVMPARPSAYTPPVKQNAAPPWGWLQSLKQHVGDFAKGTPATIKAGANLASEFKKQQAAGKLTVAPSAAPAGGAPAPTPAPTAAPASGMGGGSGNFLALPKQTKTAGRWRR